MIRAVPADRLVIVTSQSPDENSRSASLPPLLSSPFPSPNSIPSGSREGITVSLHLSLKSPPSLVRLLAIPPRSIGLKTATPSPATVRVTDGTPPYTKCPRPPRPLQPIQLTSITVILIPHIRRLPHIRPPPPPPPPPQQGLACRTPTVTRYLHPRPQPSLTPSPRESLPRPRRPQPWLPCRVPPVLPRRRIPGARNPIGVSSTRMVSPRRSL